MHTSRLPRGGKQIAISYFLTNPENPTDTESPRDYGMFCKGNSGLQTLFDTTFVTNSDIRTDMGQNFAELRKWQEKFTQCLGCDTRSGFPCSAICNWMRSGKIAEGFYQIRQTVQQIERVGNRLVRLTPRARNGTGVTHRGPENLHRTQPLALAVRHPCHHVLPLHVVRLTQGSRSRPCSEEDYNAFNIRLASFFLGSAQIPPKLQKIWSWERPQMAELIQIDSVIELLNGCAARRKMSSSDDPARSQVNS
jgi:hypothetical protein